MQIARRYIIPIATSLFLGTLLVTSVVTFIYRSTYLTGIMITDEVLQLQNVFRKIHETCTIIDFDYQKNRINFLNVEKFLGSEVGPMNMVNPEKWEGPYLKNNPTIQEIEYQVVRTTKGYFITPGEGVKLPNGKVVGTDIILDESADIPAMMQDEMALMYQGKSLAAPLDLSRRLFGMGSPS